MQRIPSRTVARLRDKLVNQKTFTRMSVEEGENGGNEGIGVL
jgi:hypothetical protein